MGTIMNSDGMGIMNFDVMDTAFHSGDEWDTMSVEVSPVLHSEFTKYCPMLSVLDLLVTFH